MEDNFEEIEESGATSRWNSMGRFMEDPGHAVTPPGEQGMTAGLPDLPNYRVAGADTPYFENSLTGCRERDKAPRFTSISIIEEREGCIGHGNSVSRQIGAERSIQVSEQNTEEVDPMPLLPGIMARYATNLASRRDIRPVGAAMAVVAGVSAALGKLVHVVTKDDKVHANLYVMNIASSGEGKKGFHVPVEKASRVLGELEAASKPDAARAAKEARALEREIQALQASDSNGDVAKLADLKQRALKCQLSSFPRNLAFGEDATPQMIARSIVRPGQGGACVINSGEGAMFFSKVGGRTKGDVGYGTLLTTCFNDTTYKLSR